MCEKKRHKFTTKAKGTRCYDKEFFLFIPSNRVVCMFPVYHGFVEVATRVESGVSAALER